MKPSKTEAGVPRYSSLQNTFGGCFCQKNYKHCTKNEVFY